MKRYKPLIFIFIVVFFSSCGDDSKNPNDVFSILIKDAKKSYKTSDVLKVSIKNKKNKTLESITYSIDAENLVTENANVEKSIPLSGQKMGKRSIIASIKANGKEYTVSKDFIITASQTPKLYGYTILETYPHDIDAYTQGLEFENDTLYESTGLRNKSTLRKTNYITGEVFQNEKLADQYFGEGLTILNGKIYQLTWQANTGFIYNLNTMEKSGTFVYGDSKEGWGLCNDGTMIYKSDGTEKIWTLNPNTLAEEGYIEIYTNTSKIPKVNELEWVNGNIYANIYQKDAVAIVDPNTGAVEGVIDLKGLKEQVSQHSKLDVLNGIAYNGEPNILYVTGKNWDKMFKIEIVEK
jgi:glutaminyl-peptide cyclotransferase